MGVGSTVVLAAIHFLPLGLAVAIGGIVFGVFYEFQQWYRKEGAVELLDAVATAAPGWAAWGVIELLQFV